MTALAFPLRLGARTLAAATLPFLTGARDQLSFYEKQGLNGPLESLGEFLLGAVGEAGLQTRAEELQRFLQLCMPASSRLYGGRSWLQLSAASGQPGLGLAIFNDKRRIQRCFDDYLEVAGITGPAAHFARALLAPFADSAYAQLRAEFRPGAPLRLSLYAGWVLEPFRSHDRFAKLFDALDPALADAPLIAHARQLAAIQAPELYPYGLGVSFTPDAETPELKIYTTRFDDRQSPLRGDSCAQALLDTLNLDGAARARVHDLHDRLWEAAATKAIQIAATLQADDPAPSRVSLLYCGVPSSDATKALTDSGFPASVTQPFELFHEHFSVRRPMYLGVGVGPEGLSDRVKLYDAAFIRDTDTSALERLQHGHGRSLVVEPPLLIPARRRPPGPSRWATPSLVVQMLRDPFATLHQLRARYGDVIDLASLGVPKTYFVFAPEGVQRMFRDNANNYVRGQNFRNVAKVVGNGIVVSEGPFWRSQRKQVSAALTRSVVTTQVDRMVGVIAKMFTTWDRFAETGEWFDVAHQMREVTRRITLEIMLGINEDEEASDISKTWEQVYDALTYFTTRPWQPPLSLPLPRNRTFRRAMDALDARIYEKIAEQRVDPEAKGDLIRFLLGARDADSGRPMTEGQLRDELVTVSSAGFDTAAVTLAWTCYLLAQHPWAAHRIAQEAEAVLGDRLPTAEDLPELRFTRLVINESMRMYPAAWVLTRTCSEDDELCGYSIPGGSMVITSAWVVHHHPGHWERPEQFWPERFSKEHSAGRSRFAFFPFGDGPRKCPGEPFALAEITAAIALLCRRFVIRMKQDHPVELEPSFTLRPRHGLMMRLESRPQTGPGFTRAPNSSPQTNPSPQ